MEENREKYLSSLFLVMEYSLSSSFLGSAWIPVGTGSSSFKMLMVGNREPQVPSRSFPKPYICDSNPQRPITSRKELRVRDLIEKVEIRFPAIGASTDQLSLLLSIHLFFFWFSGPGSAQNLVLTLSGMTFDWVWGNYIWCWGLNLISGMQTSALPHCTISMAPDSLLLRFCECA